MADIPSRSVAPGAPPAAGARPWTAEPPLLVIGPDPVGLGARVREIWSHRELLVFLAWRDFKVRYKQTVLGAAWAVIQPLATMAVFSIFLGHLGHMPSDGVPYPLFTYCALLPWSLFAYILTEGGNSVVGNQSLITKVYFPRLILTLAPVLVGLVDFGIGAVLLVVLMMVYGVVPGPLVLAAPVFVLLAVLAAVGAGIWLAALNVRYRDVKYTIPFLVQLWLFATPVAYPSSLLGKPWRTLYGLNPMSGVVEGFRWALLGRGEPPGLQIAVSVAVVLIVLLGGVWYFGRLERAIADIA